MSDESLSNPELLRKAFEVYSGLVFADHRGNDYEIAAVRACLGDLTAAVLARMSSPSHDRAMAEGGWQPMSSARKDGTPVLLKLKDGISKDRRDLRYWNGLTFVGQHPGVESDGFDLGWQFAAPVGQGGFSDNWFDGWHAIPAPPLTTTQEGETP